MKTHYEFNQVGALLVLFLTLTFWPGRDSHGQIIAYEGFDYPTGGVNGRDGGVGWAGAWADNLSGGAASVVTGSHIYTGLTSSGDKLFMYDTDANPRAISRALAATVGQGDETVWLSFLVQKNNSAREARLSLNGLQAKAGSSTWQVKTPNTNFASTGVTWNGLHLFLVKVDFSTSGSDVAYFWVDPDLSSEPAVATADVTVSDAGFTLSSLSISHGPFGNSVQNASWDEIRLARTFPEVIGGVPNQPPTTAITTPANGATFTAGANITINATASDSDGQVSKVQFFSGATLLGEDVSSPYSFTWSNVAAGNYVLTAVAIDNAGAGGTSTAVNIVVNEISTASNVALGKPTTASSQLNSTNTKEKAVDGDRVNNSSRWVSTNSPWPHWIEVDLEGTFQVDQLKFWTGLNGYNRPVRYKFQYWNGSAWVDILDRPSNSQPVVDETFPAVTTSKVRLFGTGGNDNYFRLYEIEVYGVPASSNTPPMVSVTSPSAGASFVEGDNITLAANASDVDGNVSKVEFFEGANKLGEDLSAPYSFTWTNVPAGNYTLTARATDNDNASTTSASVAITVEAPGGSTSPVVSITSPADGAQFNEGANITINASASDSNGTIDRVEFYNGPTLLSTDNSAPFQHTITNAVAGLYSFTAVAVDNEGNSTTSLAAVVNVNGPANADPLVSITAPADGAEFTEGTNLTVSASASDPDGSVTKVEFFNGNIKLGEDTTSPYQVNWTGLTTGFYSLIAKATDNDGVQVSADTVNIGVFPSSTGTKYYISATGDDDLNTGLSPASPWQSITKVNATTFAPGDFILFKRGDTFLGRVSISVAGTEGNPITYGAYGAGSKPVIDGSDHCFRGDNQNFITIDGLTLQGTTRPTVEMRAFDWKVRNCWLRDADDGGWGGAGIRVMNSSKNAWIENNYFSNLSGDGIYSDGNCSNIYIYDNYVGTVFDGTADNIQLRKVTGFELKRNFLTMLGTNTGKGNFLCEFSADGHIADNIVEYGNFGLNIGGDNILVERNIARFHGPASFAAGLYVQEKKDHFNVTFRYNLVHNSVNGVHMFEDFKRENFIFHNNTIYDCSDAGFLAKTKVSGEFKNNIVWSPNAQLIRVDAVIAGQTWVSDFNDIGPNYTPPAGRDANSISLDPMVVRSPFDFHLLPGSPAIDAGTDLGLTLDLERASVPQGAGVNMGAYETPGTAGSGFPPTAPTGLSVTGTASQTVELAWLDNANDEYGFFIERRDTLDWTRIASVSFNTTTFVDNTVAENLQYSYRVQSYNNNGTSLFTKTERYFVPVDFDNRLDIVAASASTSFSSNTPSKAIDNNLSTRWSKSGDPQWLQLDLGTAKNIGSLYIAFDRGIGRSYFFDVQVSNDGTTVSTIKSDTSSGTTNRLEFFDIPNVNARYVRIVMHGNSASNDNRISEIQVQKVTTPVSLPAKPGTLTATAVSTTQIDLAWTDNANNELGYWVGRQLGNGPLVILDTLAANATSYTDTTVEPFLTYTHMVSAFNGDGNSFSNNAVATTPQPGNTAYYISSSMGSDLNDGLSPATPLATIAAVNASRLFPGDTVKFKTGDTWRETLIVPNTGTAAENIVFTSYGTGEKPIISGAEILTGWVLDSGDVYKVKVNIRPFMATSNDVKLTRRGAIPSVQDEYFWDSSDSTLYLFDADGNPDVTGKVMQFAQRRNCLVDNGKDYIVVDGLSFRVTNSAQMLVDQGGDHWKILNNDFRYAESTGPPAGAGINANGAHNTLVKGNVLRDMHGDGIFILRSADVIIDGNTVFTVFRGANVGGDNIQITGTGSNNYQVINNWVTMEGTNGPKGCIQLESGNNGYVANNTALFGSFGIEVNGNDLLIENNLCAHQVQSEGSFGAGIYLSDRKHMSGMTFRNNIVYGAQFNGISLDATNDGRSGNYDRSNFRFYNNTLVDCGNGFRVISGQVSGEFMNNILWTNPRRFVYSVPSIVEGETWVSDHNIIASPTTDPTKYINFGGSKLVVQWKRGSNVLLNGVNSGVASGTSPTFILLRIDFDPAGNTAYMWVDPADLSTAPDIATANAVREFTENWSIGNVELEHTSTTSHESRFDEIRIGNTFAEAFSGTTGIAYEGFDYPTGTGTLGGSNGGYGWGTPWKVTSGNKDNIASGSFTFPGVTSSGNRGEIRGTVNRTLLNNIQRTSGSVWMGFFIWNTNSSRTSRLRLSEQGGTRFGSLTEFQRGTGLDLNSKQADPQFVDESNNDYRLVSSSPAIDMGTALTFTSDFEGNTRPQGNTFDAGAYESSFTNTESAPSVSITSPANNSSFTAGSDIVISASTADADGSVVKVEFFNGFLKLGEDTAAPFDFTWSNVISGNYTLYAVATDNDGNITTSAGIDISSTGCAGCRQADDLKEASEVVIYPNAAVADFYVRIKTQQSAMTEIVITDLKGLVVKNRLVQLQEGDNTVGFQKGSMKEGVYMVKIESAYERIIKKLVVLE